MGFSDAIFPLAAEGGTTVKMVLHSFAEIGDKSRPVSSFDTVRGKAQSALAKLGDARELEKILEELHSIEYRDAVKKLQYIGGQVAVAALSTRLKNMVFWIN